MATKRRKTRIVKIRVSALLAMLMVGTTTSAVISRITAPEKVKTITVTKEVEVPKFNNKTPKAIELKYVNVPLSESLQRYIQEVCAEENVPYALVLAMIEKESGFNIESISNTNDYGLMQINKVNHERLSDTYKITNILDPYQNVYCGIKMIASHINQHKDLNKALMAYNMGSYGAARAWENGISSTNYSTSILSAMDRYEGEINAE